MSAAYSDRMSSRSRHLSGRHLANLNSEGIEGVKIGRLISGGQLIFLLLRARVEGQVIPLGVHGQDLKIRGIIFHAMSMSENQK